MNKKLLLKLGILVVGLLNVLVFKGYLQNKPYTQPNIFEVTNSVSSFQWCSENKGTLKWQDSHYKGKYKNFSAQALRTKFCKVELEPLSGAEMNNANWRELAHATDSQASIVKLEWDRALQVFRAAGLPFKSKKLSRELLDEAP